MRTMQRQLLDRYGEKSFTRGVSVFISIVFLLFTGYILVRYKYFLYIPKEEFFHTPLFGWIALAYAASFFALLIVITRANRRNKRSPAVWSAGIFLLALALRLAAYQMIEYVPTSDFTNYYQMGLAFLGGDYAFVAQKSAAYHIPSFSGLAVINGVLLRLFGTSVRSFQLVHCVVSSLNAVVTYCIARKVDEDCAPLAGALFALYPANVFYAQVTTNQHIAVLFALLAILLLLKAAEAEKLWKAAALSCASGVLLLASQYAHPSSAATQIAFALFLLTRVVSALFKRRDWIRPAVALAVLFAAFYGLQFATNAALVKSGLLDAETMQSSCYLNKVVIGLNVETQGSYSASDWGTVWSYPPEEQNDVCIAMIRERLAENDMAELLDTKILRLWMVKDTSFGWALFGLQEQYQADLANGTATDGRIADMERLETFTAAYQLLDFVFVALVFLFAWIGVLLRHKDKGATDLLIWIVLGQMGVYLLIEIQTRYRYFAMPLMMILAAAGVMRTLPACKKAGRKRKAKDEPPQPESMG